MLPSGMIVTFTDFGLEGPYMGQMCGALYREAPAVPVVDLMVDVPAFDIRSAAYLLAAVILPFAAGTVCLAVVDPGVGGERRPVALLADGRWYVGPDNGLFEFVARRAETPPAWWEITWRPECLSASFHGRDLFAPVAARIAAGDTGAQPTWGTPCTPDREPYADWADNWPAVIYIDRYGNCLTGIRWSSLPAQAQICLGDITIPCARTFSDVLPGTVFCYENALGLLEVAINKGNAADILQLYVGSQVSVR